MHAISMLTKGCLSLLSWRFLLELTTHDISPQTGLKLSLVYKRLETDYHMQCPEGSHPAIFDVMKQVWEWEPSDKQMFAVVSTMFNDTCLHGLSRWIR